MQRFRFLRSFYFLYLILLPCCAVAQNAVSSLHGVITDPGNATVGRATVIVSRSDTGFARQAVTSDSGEYSFLQLTPGVYTVTVKAAGFADASRLVELLVNEPATVSFAMSISAVNTVEVDSTASALNSVDATVGTPFNTIQIQTLPFEGNNILDLLSLQPGVLFTGDANQNSNTDTRPGSVNGARSDQNNITLDGVDNNLVSKGYAFSGVLRPTRDSLQEFRVVTTNSNADAGISSGAQVSLLTRGGTNSMHGSAYYYYRPTNTVANDWFLKASEFVSGKPNVPAKFLRHLYGASLGGAIVKDKIFYFGAYEGVRRRESDVVTNTVPSAAFIAGNLSYVNGQGGVSTLTRSNIATMDPKCSANGSCPQGPGVNPAALAYFAQYPHSNSTTKGDGYNFLGYTFASPAPLNNATSTVRFDFDLWNAHRIFARGNLQQDNSAADVSFPGAPPSSQTFDNSRGLAAGDIWSISPRLTNDLRYGLTRPGSAIRGDINSPYVSFGTLTPLAAYTTSQVAITLMHNIVDDITYTRGRHTIQAGANYRLVLDEHSTNATIFNNATVATGNLVKGGIAGTGTSLDPGAFGFPAVASSFVSSYNTAIANITGLITEATGYANYSISNNALTPLPPGLVPLRHFLSNELEYYVQDSWKVRPNLTFTLGVRHTLLQSPYERNAQQVVPTVNLNSWFQNRVLAAAQGGVNQPPISFTQGGQAAGKPAYWNMDKLDLAPRFAFAWQPHPDTTVRGGFGMYYDHFGSSLIYALDQRGSFGLSSTLSNGASQFVDTAPRFTSITAVPSSLIPQIGNPGSFPVTPPNELLTAWVLDSKLKTPYAYVMDFSVQQELGKGTVFELNYVGRLGRRLMQQLDLAEPLNVRDTTSGIDYYTAATQFAKDVDLGVTPAQVPKNAFWENQFPLAAANGLTATQTIYKNQYLNNRGNETEGIFELDTGLTPGAQPGQLYRYFNPQYVNLVGFTSIGTASYHSLQAALHRPFAHGLQYDVNYVFSKSLDLGSDGERVAAANSRGYSQILNSFNPRLNRGPSDFDVRHNVTVNTLAKLPVGRGQKFLGNTGGLVDELVGGWMATGLAHWTSGLPFNAYDGKGWTTNFDLRSYMVQTGPVKSGGHGRDAKQNPNAFASPSAALLNMRLPYPGEAGQRNNFRGDGYFGIDLGVRKTFPLFESQNLQIAAEALNITNSVRFDPKSVSNNANNSASFGVYSTQLTQSRRMQFSARYSF
jgi:hypothetical protein